MKPARALVCGFLLALSIGTAFGAALDATPADRFRGGKVEWTRLNTGHRYWDRHSNCDAMLLQLMREHTPLNIAGEWRATRADDLATLSTYPFVYAADISGLPEGAGKNLAEYLRRGGFLFIDCCINRRINPDPVKFAEAQRQVLAKHLANLRVVDLAPDHPVYFVYFKMTKFPPITRRDDSWSKQAHFPLRALYVDDRIVGLISLGGLQCAWDMDAPGSRSEGVESMQMATNIYLYAMTR
jgi:hypothetical protein